MLPIFNLDALDNISDNDIQFTINEQLFLDTLLIEIRGKAISYSSYITRTRNNRENHLKSEIGKLEENFSENNVDYIVNLKAELQEIQDEKLKGAMIRSRVDWIQHGEKPSKQVCNLEKHNYTTKTINSLIQDDGTVLDKQKDILNETAKFYKKLFQNKDCSYTENDFDNYTKQLNIPRLTKGQSKELEGPITLSEAKCFGQN
jgi:hypothetical protein